MVLNMWCGTANSTGKERDFESGLDDFGARHYSAGLGRFLTTDWSLSPSPIVYGSRTDPQTLNLYRYARNNPSTLTDPDGHHEECGPSTSEMVNGALLVKPGPCHEVPDWWQFRWLRRALPYVMVPVGVVTRSARPGILRRIWLAAHPGETWPQTADGKNFDAHHKQPLRDGGAERDPNNIEPREHSEHMDYHSKNGDFSRWARENSDNSEPAPADDEFSPSPMYAGQDPIPLTDTPMPMSSGADADVDEDVDIDLDTPLS